MELLVSYSQTAIFSIYFSTEKIRFSLVLVFSLISKDKVNAKAYRGIAYKNIQPLDKIQKYSKVYKKKHYKIRMLI